MKKALFSPPYERNGFTLLELMVVVFIVGIVATLATISVSTSSDHSIETEAKRFTELSRLLAEEAIINSQTRLIEIGMHHYQFLAPSSTGELAPMEGDSLFKSRDLDESIKIKADLMGEVYDFEFLDKDATGFIEFHSSGEVKPFVVTFIREDGVAYQVKGNLAGQIDYVGKVSEDDY